MLGMKVNEYQCAVLMVIVMVIRIVKNEGRDVERSAIWVVLL